MVPNTDPWDHSKGRKRGGAYDASAGSRIPELEGGPRTVPRPPGHGSGPGAVFVGVRLAPHRFWVVLGATLVGGIAGLMYTSKTPGIPTLVVGLLAAIAAGMLALALVRVVAFVAGGLLVYTAVLHTPLSWEYSLVAGLVGGLLGVFLFRFWTMVLTSMVGTLLSGYAAVLLLDRANVLDAASFAKQYPVLANWLWGLLSLLGLLIQFVLERRRIHKKRWARRRPRRKPGKRRSRRLPSRLHRPSAPGGPWGGARISVRPGETQGPSANHSRSASCCAVSFGGSFRQCFSLRLRQPLLPRLSRLPVPLRSFPMPCFCCLRSSPS